LQQRRNLLLKRIIKSHFHEDFKILRSAIEQEIEKSQEALPAPEYGITGIMLFTAAGGILKIENKDMIVGHCIPIHEVAEIKHLNEQQIEDRILRRSFDMNKIADKNITELRDPAEKVIKTILEQKERIIYENIPHCYKGLQRFIGIYPVLDDEKLIGALAVFKDNSRYLFPEEDKVIQGLIDNIRIIMSIREGKFIQHERNRLQGEMNIARKIQLSILPKEINLKGYDCACSMDTATEAGGDAYDFISTGYGNYFGIGDVSGHGLPAGIIALMQMSAFESSVYTAEILQKEIKPDEIYNSVNRVLYNINRKRIGSDKYMTQNYLIEEQGNIIHAGAHEIALHYMEKEEKVYERKNFAKKTAFLGISPSINAEESLDSFTLGNGDVLVLYSDGVIEAKNHYSKQFGLPRLKEVLQTVADLSSKEIIEEIKKALYEFAKDGDLKRHNGAYADDVTLLVIKKL
jgi:sigma-B regulation protein RsbU (phosphoserine phosphatase)